MGFIGDLVNAVGFARHRAAVDEFLQRVLGLQLSASELDNFAPLISAGYAAESSIEDISLRIATAYYAKACLGSSRERESASRLFMKLPFVISVSSTSGAISLVDAEEFLAVVQHYTQQKILGER